MVIRLKQNMQRRLLSLIQHIDLWLVVNSKPLAENYDKFMTYICKAYKGKSLEDRRSILSKTESIGKEKSIPQKVALSLYYDSLNTSCATFIVKNLAKIFDDDLITILNLRLVPRGDAYANKSNNSTVFCQHRPDGCKLNSLEACAIDVMHDVNKHFALIYCIEFLAIEGRQKEWETCFSSLGLPKKPILDCYNSSNATQLEQTYGNEIMHLNPPLKFVPWLVLNNQPIGNDYENFASYVCKAYKGKIEHMACQSVHLKQKTE